MGDESGYVIQNSQEAPDFFTIAGGCNLHIALTFEGSTSMSLLLNTSNLPKVALNMHLVRLRHNLNSLIQSYDLFIVFMTLSMLSLGNYITDIFLYLLVHHVVKKSNHCMLIRRFGILKAKRHDLGKKGSPWRDKHCLFFILILHFYLIIFRKSIHEGKQFKSSSTIYKNINVG